MAPAAILDFRALERYFSGVRFVEYFSFVQYIGPVNLKPQNGCSGGGVLTHPSSVLYYLDCKSAPLP